MKFKPTPSQLVILFSSLLVLMLLLVSCWEIWQERMSEQRRIQTELSLRTESLADQTETALRGVDLILRSTIEFRSSTPEKELMNYRLTHERLKARVSGLPYVAALIIFDTGGRNIASSRSLPAPVVPPSTDRDYFRVHTNTGPNGLDVGMYIDKPVTNRATGKRAIFMSRRITGQLGEFLGIVAAEIDPVYIEDMYKNEGENKTQRAMFLKNDATLLAVSPNPENSLEQPFTRNDLFFKIVSNSPQGIFTGKTPIDTEPLIISYRHLDSYPLVITQSITEKSAFEVWKYRAFIGLAKLFLGIDAIILLAWLLVKRTKALEASEKTVIADGILLAEMNDHLERLIERRTAKLEASIRELDAFCHSVSHDLRTPLRSITGFSQVLAERCNEKLDSKELDYLQRITLSAKQMGRLIDALLGLSRLSRHKIKPEAIDISAMAVRILDELKRNEPERDVRIVVAQGMSLDADNHLIELALRNLILNAWKYTSKSPAAKIEIGCRQIESEKVFFVADNGEGFDMKYKDKLFKPFEQLHDAQQFEGMGIGLAAVQRIIEAHHGRVWAEGAPGQGATLYFTIP